MQHITLSDIKKWERFYRANFINCLSGFKSATLIGTLKENLQPNLGLFSNVFHVGADPAIIGFVNRPREATPHSISNIERTGVYTMNLVPELFTANAHQTSAKYDLETDEFSVTGFTAEFLNDIEAPFVAESKIKYAMQLLEVIPIKHNGAFLVLGSVTDILIDEGLLNRDGFIHLEKAGTITSLGIDGYYTSRLQGRYKYAKAGEPVSTIV
jgi:flavin reductase (DIM6/NTAB) family NADH-FMN oxidoreductase RutF